MYCQSCGTNNQDGVQFCASCGQVLRQNAQYQNYQQPFMQQGAPGSPEADAQQNKTMGILAYFIFFIPLLAAKESRFARYHANQGLILLLGYVALGIVNMIINGILFSAISYGTFGLWGIISLLFTLVYLGLAVPGVFGIINAVQGRMKPMPVIGKLFTIIK